MKSQYISPCDTKLQWTGIYSFNTLHTSLISTIYSKLLCPGIMNNIRIVFTLVLYKTYSSTVT